MIPGLDMKLVNEILPKPAWDWSIAHRSDLPGHPYEVTVLGDGRAASAYVAHAFSVEDIPAAMLRAKKQLNTIPPSKMLAPGLPKNPLPIKQ